MTKHVVAPAAELASGRVKIVTVNGREIGIFNLRGAYFALLNRCPHAGAALCKGQVIGLAQSDEPGEYRLDRPGEMIRCPWHGWEYDIRTGQSWCDPEKVRVPRFEVARETGEDIVKGPYIAETFSVAVENDYLVVDLTMSISARPLHPPRFFGEVTGIDFTRELDAATARTIISLNDEYGVLVFPKTELDDDGHVAVSRMLGPLELAPKLFAKEEDNRRRLKLPELFEAGNLDADGNIQRIDDRFRMFARGNRLWHTDSSFYQQRSKYSLLLAHFVPPGGADTEFADMRAAYDALPQATKDKIEDLVCEHDVWYSRELAGFPDVQPEEKNKRAPARHRLVQLHPSGRKTLLLASHASKIVGWPVDQGRALLRELMLFATEARFVHRHVWTKGDLVMWDNRCTMHRATPFDDMRQKRDMRRTTVIDDAA